MEGRDMEKKIHSNTNDVFKCKFKMFANNFKKY